MSTLEKLQAHLAAPKQEFVSGFWHKPNAEKVICADGFKMSVQASKTHYSHPRKNIGPYTEVEVWLCGTVPEWSEYGDGEEPYAYVPIELVVQVIDQHGGMK